MTINYGMKYIIANWKMNLSRNEVLWWLDAFSEFYEARENVRVLIAPSYLHIEVVQQKLKDLGLGDIIGIASQDISAFEKGKFTGEVGAFQLSDYGVQSVIIGHSERRESLAESDKTVNLKIEKAANFDLLPIVAVSNQNHVKSLTQSQRPDHILVAYEPIEAIGTGNPASVESVNSFLTMIKSELGERITTIYGGSIDRHSVKPFLSSSLVEGFLVGTAALDPSEFWSIISQVD